MAFEALTSIPCEFESGNSVTVTMPLPDVSPSEGEAKLYLSLNGTAVTNITATESGDEFTFTISAAASAALAPGLYDYAIYFTYTGTQRISIATGQIRITPNLATSQTASDAQTMLTALNATITTLMASGNASVSFNGQSFTRRNLDELIKMRTQLRAEVIAERRAAARARGDRSQGVYAPNFISSHGACSPFCR
jgi:hypothetical protein